MGTLSNRLRRDSVKGEDGPCANVRERVGGNVLHSREGRYQYPDSDRASCTPLSYIQWSSGPGTSEDTPGYEKEKGVEGTERTTSTSWGTS